MSSRSGYWNRKKFGRRAILRGAGAATLAGVGLSACGDDDDDDPVAASPTAAAASADGSPAAAATAAATSASEQPKRGGVYRGVLAGDPGSLDPMFSLALPTHQTAGFTYSKLFRYKAGPGIDRGLYQTEPDIAESVEISDDGLTYIVKLRPDVKFHPPINRVVDAEDVVFSWLKYTGQAPGTTPASGAPTMNEYLESVSATDERTAVFKLKRRQGDFIISESRYIWIMPKEAGTAFDPTQMMVGTGPWIFESYTPGSVVRYRRNPEWHLGPEAPYLDRVELNLIPEYATRLNQFMAGNLDETDIAGNDLTRVQSNVKGLQLYVGPATLPASQLAFAPFDRGGGAPWADPRVRRALCMCLDRNAILDAAYNLPELEKLNLGVQRRWNNDIPASESGYWLDPQGQYQAKPSDPKMTAENLKSFAYNPGEARKLLEAAGQLDVKFGLYTTGTRYGQAYNIISELTQQFAKQAGFDLDLRDVDYNSVFIPQLVQKHDFDGVMHVPRRTGVRAQYATLTTPARHYSEIDDPVARDKMLAVWGNTDPEAARIEILDLQNYVNDKMYSVPMDLGSPGAFVAYSPTIRNALEYQVNGDDWGSETVSYRWRA